MEMIIQLALLTVGFVLLVKGADWFVDGAASIAEKLGIPQLVIGLTIVALGTSAPEAAVSLTAAFHGNADITIGNVVGSNILNILIILGLAAVICPMKVARLTAFVDIPVTIVITLLLLLLGYDGTVSRLDAGILLLFFIAYLSYLFTMTKKGLIVGESEEEGAKIQSVPKALLFTVVGLALIIVGSSLAVDAASAIATMLGLSERFIGLTIVALGTSLPELFTSVAAAIKKNPDMAIGNIVGSNIFNILFIVGLSGLVIPVPFVSAFRFDTLIAMAATVLLFVLTLPTKRLGRVAGIIMLAGYVAYFAMIW
ncbi:MAG: calcium/sodium antiporter [Spirochaetaceae bacterium]|nr:calcium/sodium antiporter [Spirochaetaceae bacterium]